MDVVDVGWRREGVGSVVIVHWKGDLGVLCNYRAARVKGRWRATMQKEKCRVLSPL
jgi:hypothetical protein